LLGRGEANVSGVTFTRELKDFRTRVVAKLQVAFDAPAIELFKRSSKTLLILLFFYSFLFLAIVTFFGFRWIIRPLSSISGVLEEHSVSRISTICANNDEFGQMAQLIKNYFHQEDDLKSEIVEKSRMIEALHLSEDKFSKIFRSSPVLMALTYFDSGVYIDVNDVFLESFGYSRQEVIGKSSIELGIFTPKERERMLDQLKLKGTVSNMEIKFMARAGQERIMLFSAETVDMEGRKVIINVAKDITERINMESELKRKIEELEKFNKFAVGREVRMIELKNRIRELEEKLGQNNR
jgi:PAS domain S-box-containing protein